MAPLSFLFSLCHINSMEKKNRDEYFKTYYQANKAKYAERDKAWRKANPEKSLAFDRKWKANNHDKIVKYRERTKEKRNAWQREYRARQYAVYMSRQTYNCCLVQRTEAKVTALNTKASPPYPSAHSGPVIVAGNAWCLHEDLAQARKIIGDVPVIAVNGASREVKAIALYSTHPHRFTEKGCEWIRHQRRLFGDGFTVHGSNKEKHGDLPYVDYWWNIPGGGGSAWGARKIAKLMGFSQVVLCGCPLVPGNYTGHRMGMLMSKQEVTDQYAAEIASDTDWHKGSYSMSGKTRDILGCL